MPVKKQNKGFRVEKILFPKPRDECTGFQEHFSCALKNKCNKFLTFNFTSLQDGKDSMNKRFLDFVKKEKPDLIFLWITSDEIYPETLVKVKEVSPNSKLINLFGDDDLVFDDFSRYLVLFFDYGLIGQKRYMDKYKKEGNKNVFFISSANTDFLKPLNLEKIYDVTLIGSPKLKPSGRYDLVKFLKDSGVNLKLFGRGWHKYHELKDVYQGILTDKEMVKVLNQSKITLCLSRQDYGDIHLTGRIFEAGACKSFVLTESCDEYLEFFDEKKEIVMFKTKEELLKQINYYLKKEKERNKIAEAAYKKILKEYTMESQLNNLFKVAIKDSRFSKTKDYKPSKKIKELSKKDLTNIEMLRDSLKDYDYVSFFDGAFSNLKYRQYLQEYSLKKSGKPISCCDYYVHNSLLGDYLYFSSNRASRTLSKTSFDSFLNLNQLLVDKEYFLRNLPKFQKAFDKNDLSFINKDNTAFVSLPLIRIKKINYGNYEDMSKAFTLRFMYYLYRLKSKKFKGLLYLFNLLKGPIKKKRFILRSLFEIFRDRDKMKTVGSNL